MRLRTAVLILTLAGLAFAWAQDPNVPPPAQVEPNVPMADKPGPQAFATPKKPIPLTRSFTIGTYVFTCNNLALMSVQELRDFADLTQILTAVPYMDKRVVNAIAFKLVNRAYLQEVKP